MEPREKYERQPFISYSGEPGPPLLHYHGDSRSNVRETAHQHHRRNQRTRRTSKCGACCCVCFVLLALLIFAILLPFLILVWPSECFHILGDDAPIQVGINVRTSRVFLIFTKPLPTGAFNSSLNVCGQTTNLDTTFFPAFGGLRLAMANFSLRTQRCQNLPHSVDADRGTLKFIIDGGANETAVSIQNVHVTFNSIDLPEHGYFELTSNEDGGVKARRPVNEVTIDFVEDGVATFEPAVGVIYSKFVALVASEVTLFAGNSTQNYCGAPAIGVTIDGGIFGKAWSAFRHWVNHSFPAISPIGIAQLFQLTSLQISKIQLSTKPVIFETKTTIEPKHVPVFLKQGRLQVDKSVVSLSNFSLQISGSKKDDVHLKTLARITIDLPAGNVEAVAVLKHRLHLITSFRNAHFELPFDIEISNGNYKAAGSSNFNDSEPISLKKMPQNNNTGDSAAGSFTMKNITVRTADNSSIFTPMFSGNVETIYVRSLRQIITTQQCSAMLLKLITIDFTTSAMTVPAGESLKVVVVGNPQDTRPLTVNLYQLGRVSNNLKMIVSTSCLEEQTPPPPPKMPNKRHSFEQVEPRSEALATAGNYPFLFNYSLGSDSSSEKGVPRQVNEDVKIQLHYWMFDAHDVDARVYPMENILQIDKIMVKMNASNVDKANLDLQVGLKQSSAQDFLKALL